MATSTLKKSAGQAKLGKSNLSNTRALGVKGTVVSSSGSKTGDKSRKAVLYKVKLVGRSTATGKLVGKSRVKQKMLRNVTFEKVAKMLGYTKGSMTNRDAETARPTQPSAEEVAAREAIGRALFDPVAAAAARTAFLARQGGNH